MTAVQTGVHVAALGAYQRGWSVIPLIGGADRTRGKIPSVPWRSYQQSRASLAELRRWYIEEAHSAYGIVCGAVSRLVVIDFDDREAFGEFARRFPKLIHTFTVYSGVRRTPHLYYEVDFYVQSQQLRGGDLKGEGGYVVGPGSVIDGRMWQLVNQRRPRKLSRSELADIVTQFHSPEERDTSLPVPRPHVTVDLSQVAERYRESARVGQRNNTLFRLAMQLRDSGCPQQRAADLLIELHATKMQVGERLEPRIREAQRTIASAYRRPAGRCSNHVGRLPDPECVDNGLREALLKRLGGTAFLRVYEGLLLGGLRPGDAFTHAQARRRLAGRVGDHSIRLALRMTVSTTRKKTEKRCFVPQQKPTKNQKGRPTIYYTLPSPADLRRMLQVKLTDSDPVTADDLKSVRAYRVALEREFIRRRPGQYPQVWLAARLDVSVRTIYTYHRLAGIVATPCFRTTLLTKLNYQRMLPTREAVKRAGLRVEGRFIEDEYGNRYPPSADVARMLLGRRRRCCLRERTFSHYTCVS